jgi:hypothetical protein
MNGESIQIAGQPASMSLIDATLPASPPGNNSIPAISFN